MVDGRHSGIAREGLGESINGRHNWFRSGQGRMGRRREERDGRRWTVRGTVRRGHWTGVVGRRVIGSSMVSRLRRIDAVDSLNVNNTRRSRVSRSRRGARVHFEGVRTGGRRRQQGIESNTVGVGDATEERWRVTGRDGRDGGVLTKRRHGTAVETKATIA